MTTTVPAPPAPNRATPRRPDAERQLAAAHAIPAIITATIDLPLATWIVDSTGWRLYGYIHDRDPRTFHAYADRLGGTVTIGRTVTDDHRPARDLTLDTTYNGTPVQIAALAHADEQGTGGGHA